MSALIVLLGCLLQFANPDVRSDSVRMEAAAYELSGGISAGGENLNAGLTPGLGLSLTGEYLDQRPMRHPLAARMHENSSSQVHMYAVGLDYVLQLPRRPIQLAVGAELGTGQLVPKGFQKIKAAPEKPGWEIHTEVIQYIVFRDRLMQFYLRPGWRQYDFPVEGGNRSTFISGNGFSLSGGLGMKF